MSKVYQALKKAERERMVDGVVKKENGKNNITSSFDQHLIAYMDPRSISAEQFKKLRTKILQYSDSDLKSILITSSIAQEGKSLTAVNLAITIAQGVDESVLLVDADFRKPSIEKLLGINSTSGLSDYLREDVDISNFLLETGIPKLKFIPAGTPTDRPSELLASKKMKNLLKELKSSYEDRYIILDSAPIMPTDEPDILANQVDGVIIVVKFGKTPKEVIKKTLGSLSGVNILGIVFNGVEFTTKRHQYYYYYK